MDKPVQTPDVTVGADCGSGLAEKLCVILWVLYTNGNGLAYPGHDDGNYDRNR